MLSLLHKNSVSRSLLSYSKNVVVLNRQQNTIRNVHRTFVHFQGARKNEGISHILQQQHSQNKTKTAAPAKSTTTTTKTTTDSRKSTKEQEEIDELQALLDDEEILTPQRKKTPSASLKSQQQTPASSGSKLAQVAGASAFGAAAASSTKASSSSSKLADQMGLDEKEMQQMMKSMGLDERWDQYKDMLDAFEEGKFGGRASENWDEADMDEETKKSYKMFGKNYLKSLKSEFDKPELFNFIKTQADGNAGVDLSSLASVAGLAGAASAGTQASQTKAGISSQQQTTAPRSAQAPSTTPSTSKQKKSLTLDEIENMDLDLDANTVAKDFENPEMRKALKTMFGAKSDEDLDKFKDALMNVFKEGKNIKSLESQLETQMKELDSIFSFAKDLHDVKPPKKKK